MTSSTGRSRCPSTYKLRGRTGKYLLKKAARGKIPGGDHRSSQKGVRHPAGQVAEGQLAGAYRRGRGRSPVWSLGALSQTTFQAWNREHQSLKKDHSKPLWALFVLDHWLRRQQTLALSK